MIRTLLILGAVVLIIPLSVNAARAQGSPLRLLAIAPISSSSLETTSTTFQDIPDTLVNFKVKWRPAGCVLAQLSLFSRGDGGSVIVRAMLDGQEMGPSHARFAASVPEPGAFTFFQCDVTRGEHQLVIQYRSAAEGTAAVIAEHSLVVMGAKQRGVFLP